MQERKDEIIDLTLSSLSDQLNEEYLCEECGVTLLEYPKAQVDNPFAGKSYICPRCHAVTDSSLNPMRNADEIKPVDYGMLESDEVIQMVDEVRGIQRTTIEDTLDIEHDKWLESQGFRIVDKKVEIYKD